MPQNYRRVQCSQCSAYAACLDTDTSYQCRKCRFENVLAPEPVAKPTPRRVVPTPPVEEAEVTVPVAAIRTWSILAIVLFVVLGLAAGSAIAYGLSLLKAEVGTGGLVGAFIIGALTVPVAAGVYFFARSASHDPANAWAAPARRWSGAALAVAAGCALPCFAMVVAEGFGPPEGFVKRSANRAVERDRLAAREAEEREKKEQWDAGAPARELARAASEKQRQDDLRANSIRLQQEQEREQAWQAADVILVNPGNRAVALKRNRDPKLPEFTLLNTASESELNASLAKAWIAKVPMVANPDLARHISGNVKLGQKLAELDAKKIDANSQFLPLLPVKVPLVSFKDKVSKQLRYGHLIESNGDKFTFVKLLPKRNYTPSADALPFASEVYSKSDVLEFRTVTADELEKSADRLDSLLYRALSEMQAKAGVLSPSDWQIRPHIYVDDVYIRETAQSQLVRELTSQIRTLKEDKRRALTNPTEPSRLNSIEVTGLIPTLLLMLGDHANELRRQRDAANRSEREQRILDEEIAKAEEKKDQLERLERAAVDLKDDMHKRLSDMGIPVPDRSVRARDIFLKLDPKNMQWIGNRPNAQVAFRDGLDQATHILLADIAPPKGSGSYYLSMRIVDFRTGATVWADNGDREIYVGNPFLPQGTPPVSLVGIWRCPGSNVRIRVTEKDRDITFSMISTDEVLTKFEVNGKRSGNAIKATTCHVVYHPSIGFPAGNYSRKAEVRIVNEQKLIISTQTAHEGKAYLKRSDGQPWLTTTLQDRIFEKEK